MVEIDRKRRAGEIFRGELERRLGQVDAVIVAHLGAGQRALHHAGVAAGNVEKAERCGEACVESIVQQAADFAMREIVALHQLAIGGPLLLELLERGGIHHRAARLELMNMDVDQLLLLGNA